MYNIYIYMYIFTYCYTVAAIFRLYLYLSLVRRYAASASLDMLLRFLRNILLWGDPDTSRGDNAPELVQLQTQAQAGRAKPSCNELSSCLFFCLFCAFCGSAVKKS